MKQWLVFALGGIVLVTASPAGTAQSAPPAQHAQTQAASTQPIASGTIIQAELSKSLDAKKAKAGDEVQARVSMALLAHGRVLVPADSKIIGHVISAKAHTKESPDSKVELIFDRVLPKHGHEMPLHLAVQAIGRPLQAALSLSSGGDGTTDASVPGSPGMMGQAGGGLGGSSRPMGSTTQPPFPPQNPSEISPGSQQQSSASPLGPTSQGVFGMKGVILSNSAQGTLVSSGTQNVHLDGSSQLILRVE